MTEKKSSNFKQSALLNYHRFLYFGNNSNIHCVRYITESHRHLFCKLFWLFAIILCGWGLLEILRGTIRSAQQDALNFTPDTNRLNWNTAFPSVTICEKYLYHETLRSINKIIPNFLNQYDYNYKKMFADMCFGENPCQLCNTGCTNDVNCSIDYRAMAEKIRKPCRELIHGCNWLNDPIDCCKYFLPIDSTFGTCYSFNTKQSRLSGSVPIFKSNRSTGPGSLSFLIYKDLEVFIHGSEDIPWIKADLDLQFDASDSILFAFKVTEMTNDYEVKNMDLQMRKCLFPSEVQPNEFGQSFQIYGYSTCMEICETELMYQKCQCVHHLRDKIYKDKTCNFTGLGCLAVYAEEKKKMTVEESQILCQHCLPSCEEIEVTKVLFLEYEMENDDEDSRVDIQMTHLPNIQYRRSVVRTKLDLVVSVGGLAGLFFGASLLSLVEAFYIICIRYKTNN